MPVVFKLTLIRKMCVNRNMKCQTDYGHYVDLGVGSHLVSCESFLLVSNSSQDIHKCSIEICYPLLNFKIMHSCVCVPNTKVVILGICFASNCSGEHLSVPILAGV